MNVTGDRRMRRARTGQPRLPAFRRDEEERAFWERHRLGDYVRDLQPARVLVSDRFRSRVKERKKNVTFRLEPSRVRQIKKVARALGIGYQTLMRMWILDGLRRRQAG